MAATMNMAKVAAFGAATVGSVGFVNYMMSSADGVSTPSISSPLMVSDVRCYRAIFSRIADHFRRTFFLYQCALLSIQPNDDKVVRLAECVSVIICHLCSFSFSRLFTSSIF